MVFAVAVADGNESFFDAIDAILLQTRVKLHSRHIISNPLLHGSGSAVGWQDLKSSRGLSFPRVRDLDSNEMDPNRISAPGRYQESEQHWTSLLAGGSYYGLGRTFGHWDFSFDIGGRCLHRAEVTNVPSFWLVRALGHCRFLPHLFASSLLHS